MTKTRKAQTRCAQAEGRGNPVSQPKGNQKVEQTPRPSAPTPIHKKQLGDAAVSRKIEQASRSLPPKPIHKKLLGGTAVSHNVEQAPRPSLPNRIHKKQLVDTISQKVEQAPRPSTLNLIHEEQLVDIAVSQKVEQASRPSPPIPISKKQLDDTALRQKFEHKANQPLVPRTVELTRLRRGRKHKKTSTHLRATMPTRHNMGNNMRGIYGDSSDEDEEPPRAPKEAETPVLVPVAPAPNPSASLPSPRARDSPGFQGSPGFRGSPARRPGSVHRKTPSHRNSAPSPASAASPRAGEQAGSQVWRLNQERKIARQLDKEERRQLKKLDKHWPSLMSTKTSSSGSSKEPSLHSPKQEKHSSSRHNAPKSAAGKKSSSVDADVPDIYDWLADTEDTVTYRLRNESPAEGRDAVVAHAAESVVPKEKHQLSETVVVVDDRRDVAAHHFDPSDKGATTERCTFHEGTRQHSPYASDSDERKAHVGTILVHVERRRSREFAAKEKPFFFTSPVAGEEKEKKKHYTQ